MVWYDLCNIPLSVCAGAAPDEPLSVRCVVRARLCGIAPGGQAAPRMRDKMANNRQVRQVSRQQAYRRKKREMRDRLFHLILSGIVVVLIFCIRNLYARLDRMQDAVARLEKQRQTEVITEEGQEITEPADIVEDYAVERPVERTPEEALQRLKELAEDNETIAQICENSSAYSDEMLAALANNPEMADFVAGYSPGKTNSGGSLTDAEKREAFPLFLQWDARWGYQSYGTDSCIGLAGCGPACLSMALFYLTRDERLTPGAMAEYSMENGYYMDGTGTAWALMEDVPARYGIKVTKLSAQENSIHAVLDSGGVVVCSMGRGDFTTAGHFIVIYGYDRDGLMVNDPNCVARSRRRWTFDELHYQIKNLWGYTI